MPAIAKRMERIPFSAIRLVVERAIRLEEEGQEVLRLDVGRPDFDTPDHVKEACHFALRDGLVHYTSNYGIEPLREAIALKLKRENGLSYDHRREILVTAGVSEGVVVAMMALLNPDDEVLVLEPMFPAYKMAAQMAGAKTVAVDVSAENGYQPTLAQLTAGISNRTKMLVLTTPSNPTGTVFDQQTLQLLADFAIAHDLWVLADEIYEKLIYDGRKHLSIAALAGMRERTVTLNGFSKSHAMTGLRLGYAVADTPVIDAMVRIHQNTVVCANSLAQWGGLAALQGTQVPLQQMVAEFDRRRLMMIDRLSQMPSVSFFRPAGAMYLYVDVSSLPFNAFRLAEQLLDQTRVAVVPWDSDHIRLSYGNGFDNLQRAMNRIGDYLQQY